jgi:hypothetical protein
MEARTTLARIRGDEMSDKLPWVAWKDARGWHMSTWTGATRDVVVSPIPSGWDPSKPVPAGCKVYELPKSKRANEIIAESVRQLGVIVKVFNGYPRQPRVWPPVGEGLYWVRFPDKWSVASFDRVMCLWSVIGNECELTGDNLILDWEGPLAPPSDER